MCSHGKKQQCPDNNSGLLLYHSINERCVVGVGREVSFVRASEKNILKGALICNRLGRFEIEKSQE